MIQKLLLKAAKKWLEEGRKRSNVSASFGSNKWAEMHGGGTSFSPHCRPMGLYNPRTKAYSVKLFARPDGDDDAVEVVEAFTMETTTEPTVEEVYAKLIEKVEEKM